MKPAPAKVENAVEKTVQKPETVETKTAEPVKAETPVRASEPVKAEMPKTPVQRTDSAVTDRGEDPDRDLAEDAITTADATTETALAIKAEIRAAVSFRKAR